MIISTKHNSDFDRKIQAAIKPNEQLNSKSSNNKETLSSKINNLKKCTHEIDKPLKILHWNCNSIKSKTEDLKLFVLENKPDIILLNEIKCNQAQANSLLSINGFSTETKVRTENGGGVAILINNKIKYTVELTPDNIEAI